MPANTRTSLGRSSERGLPSSPRRRQATGLSGPEVVAWSYGPGYPTLVADEEGKRGGPSS